MTAVDMREHFHSLIDELGILYGVNEEYAEDGPFGVSSLSVELGVTLPVILLSHDPGSSVGAYLVALHEVGHLRMLRVDDEWDVEAADHISQLDREALAWSFALYEAQVPLKRQDYELVLDRLGSYASPKWEKLMGMLKGLTEGPESATRARLLLRDL